MANADLKLDVAICVTDLPILEEATLVLSTHVKLIDLVFKELKQLDADDCLTRQTLDLAKQATVEVDAFIKNLDSLITRLAQADSSSTLEKVRGQ